MLLPANFGVDATPAPVHTLYHASRPREAEFGEALIRSRVDDFYYEASRPPGPANVAGDYVKARQTSYREFLIPGIIAMAVMQTGMLSVSFAFVGMKRSGVLRRLRATPLHPIALIVAHSASRLLMMALQTVTLAAVAVWGFGVEFSGNYIVALLAAMLGGAVFLAIGFAISGGMNTERLAGAFSYVIALGMTCVSGVFFARDMLPGAFGQISDYLPLSFMVDAMRNAALHGDSIAAQWPNFLGMALWLIAALFIARIAFRWE